MRSIPVAVFGSIVLTGCSLDFLAVGRGLGFELVAIEVYPAAGEPAIVEVGDTLRLSALGRGAGLLALFNYDRLLDATWRTGHSDLIRVDLLPLPPSQDSTTTTRAIVHGRAPGVATVAVSARQVTGSIDVRVIPPIARIELVPRVERFWVGDTVEVIAVARDDGGRPIPNVPIRFEADSALDTDGIGNVVRVTAADAGRFTLTARFRRVTGRLAFTVTRPEPND